MHLGVGKVKLALPCLVKFIKRQTLPCFCHCEGAGYAGVSPAPILFRVIASPEPEGLS